MKLKFTWIVFISFFFTYTVFGQLYESIEREAADVLLSFAKNNSKSGVDLEKLRTVLFSDKNKIELGTTFHVLMEDFDSLKNHFKIFESTFQNIAVDSALVLFNQWFLQLSNTFYDYNKERFFSSNKTKILFFSASVSCHCTLEMCKNQLVDVLNFVKENNYEYDYWVVDSYWYNELQIKYETLFAPSVSALNSVNEKIFQIEYDEEMITKLNQFLLNNF